MRSASSGVFRARKSAGVCALCATPFRGEWKGENGAGIGAGAGDLSLFFVGVIAPTVARDAGDGSLTLPDGRTVRQYFVPDGRAEESGLAPDVAARLVEFRAWQTAKREAEKAQKSEIARVQGRRRFLPAAERAEIIDGMPLPDAPAWAFDRMVHAACAVRQGFAVAGAGTVETTTARPGARTIGSADGSAANDAAAVLAPPVVAFATPDAPPPAPPAPLARPVEAPVAPATVAAGRVEGGAERFRGLELD